MGSVSNSTNISNKHSGKKYTLLAVCALSVLAGFTSNTYADGGINYSITYNDGVVTNMPIDLNSTSVGSSVTLSSNVPAWDKHNFLGWCSGTITNSDGIDSCSGTTYAAGSNYTLSGSGPNALSLTAMWQKLLTLADATNMQDLASNDYCTNTTIGDTATLTDSRDGTTYTVGKLADGKCWMLDNLALDLTNSTVLNAMSESNTNASNTSLGYLKNGGGTASDQYATAKVANWTSSYSNSAPLVNMTNKDIVPTSYNFTDDPMKDAVLTGNWKVGGYYNYCAASAGSYCYGNGTSAGTSSGNATESICPAGWRMPTGSTGEFRALGTAITGVSTGNYTGDNYTNYRAALHLPLSGYFYGGSPSIQGGSGGWWSSTRNSNGNMYYLYAGTSTIAPANSSSRYGGSSLRCVAGS